jgi:site-specific recombinase XerD
MAAPSVSQISTRAANLLRSFEVHLKAEHKRQQTLDHYLGATRQFLAFAEAENMPGVESLTREHVELWLERLHETYRPHSVRNRFIGVRIFFRWLAAEGDIERDPTVRIKPPQVDEVEKDVADAADVARVLAMLTKAKRDRDAAMIAILYDTGLRATELADLRIEHINLVTGIIFIEKSKNHKTRAVKLSPAGVRYVDRYLRRLKGTPRYLMQGRGGEKMTRSGIYWTVRDAFAEAGVKARIGAHDLRHTSATHASAEMSERDMMTLFGWTDSDMARHYARKGLEAAALAAHDRASPLSRLPRSK